MTLNSSLAEPLIEGQGEQFQTLSLKLSDDDIANVIRDRIDRAISFWDREYDLTSTRKNNYNYWKNSCGGKTTDYNHQVEYIDPVVGVAVETLIPMVTSKPPQPIITAADDTDTSRELAQTLSDVLLSKYEDLGLKGKSQTIARHLLQGKRLAVAKMIWDDNVGELQPDGTRSGDWDVKVLQPENVVIEAKADDPDDIPLIAEIQSDTVDHLATRFSDKRDAILTQLGFQAGAKFDLNQEVNFYEVHFSHYTSKGKEEGIAWKLDNVVLGSMKTPFWNYEETATDADGNQVPANFLAAPRKPYVLFNHINTGKYVIDDHSLIEWAINQQDIVNKRGRQIVENADQTGSGLVYNTNMIKKTDVDKLIGDPGEKMGVAGDVRMAVARVAPPLLPAYVFNDKQDARNRINDIFGTNAPIRGENTNSPTLGQEILSQRSDLARTQVLATSLEDGYDRIYKFATQIMKVFYTDPRMMSYTGIKGQDSTTTFSNRSIEAGVKVRVRSGSVIPDDPIAKAQEAFKMAALYDPLTLVERLGLQNPREVATRMMMFRLAPDRYFEEVLQTDLDSSQADPSAIQEITAMEQGQEVPPQQNPTKEHLATHQADLEQKGESRPPEIQQMIISHVQAEIENSKAHLGQGEAPLEAGMAQEMPTQGISEGLPQEQIPGTPQQGGIIGNLLSRLGVNN